MYLAAKLSKFEVKDVGRVLHKHIAPRVFSKEVRQLMHDISKSERKLRKVSTRDRSAPFIPKDMEIYFYAGPSNDKTKAPPPASKPLPTKTEESPAPPSPLPAEVYYKEKKKRHHHHHKSRHHHRKDR